MPTLVMIFLKAPRSGTVKTRLGRDIGPAAATAVYRALAEAQLRRIPAEFRVEIHYAPRGALAEMHQWLGCRNHFRAQSGGDLGRRLRLAFDQGFRRGFGRVMAIGADCPGLDGDCLRRAEALLDRVDVVLGPAADGGYYLIGLRCPQAPLFAGIAWGSATVLATTLGRVREFGLTHRLLEEKEDIDELNGWQRHLSETSAAKVSPDASVMFKSSTGHSS